MRKCVLCGCDEITMVLTIPDFPVFMGATTLPFSDILIKDLVYGSCNNCGNLQIMELVPLDILYQDNHNLEVIGKTWEEHNESFADFVNETAPKIVFEIGSPSATIYKKLENKEWLDKWYSMEPNPQPKNFGDKFFMINGWMDERFKFRDYADEIPNAFVMSHVFEHLYNPSDILDVLYDNLETGGHIFISIPNMKYISKNNLMPPSGLHFEHTFYIQLEIVRFLFEKSGFKIEKFINFKNHSYFIRGVKSKQETPNVDLIKKISYENLINFTRTIKYYQELVESINERIKDFSGEVYIYGSHFPAQFMLALGLTGKLSGCLDQSKNKIGKVLYGTQLEVFSPEILNGKNAMVICYMGPYTDEIKEMILKINKEIIFV